MKTKKTTIERYGFDRGLQEKAKKYLSSNLVISLLQYVFVFTAAFLILKFGVSAGLERFVLGYTSDPWLVTALYFLVGFLCFWAVSPPFDYYKGYVIEHKFGLSTQSFQSWIGDQIKGLALGMILLLIIVEAIYHFIRVFPAYWWIPAWIFMSLGMMVMLFIGPIVIMPLFFKYPPLKDKVLIDKLTNLAKKAGIKVVGVYEMKAGVKTKKAMGGLTGIGRSRRIILSDTLLSYYTSDEIGGVIGHELGHHAHHTFRKVIATMSIVSLAGFFFVSQILQRTVTYLGVSGIESIASLPLFALISGVFFAIVTPVQNTLCEGRNDWQINTNLRSLTSQMHSSAAW